MVVVTCGVVAVLAVVLVVLRWDNANKVAVIVSALAAVAAVGVGVWTALSGGARDARVVVKRSGRSRGVGSVSGFEGAGSSRGEFRVEDSGPAEDGGTSGIKLT